MFTLSVNRIWVILLMATATTYWLGESSHPGRLGMAPVLLMLGMAFVKAMLVIYDFMELRHAPRLWRLLLVGWLVLVSALIVLAYWIGLR